MIVVFIASFFCVLNLCLWVAFFIKFKKIFSTEDIIDSTRNELNRMIEDINRNADRNINLIQDKIKQLKIAVAEADRHVELARREIEAQKAKVSYQQKIDSAINSRKTSQSGGDSQAAAGQPGSISEIKIFQQAFSLPTAMSLRTREIAMFILIFLRGIFLSRLKMRTGEVLSLIQAQSSRLKRTVLLMPLFR